MEVLGEAGLDCRLIAVFKHKAGDFVIAGEDLFVCEREHGAAAALAGFDLELALGSRSDDEVLQQTMRSNAGLKLGICCRITVAADIAGRLDEFVQRDRFDHGTHS